MENQEKSQISDIRFLAVLHQNRSSKIENQGEIASKIADFRYQIFSRFASKYQRFVPIYQKSKGQFQTESKTDRKVEAFLCKNLPAKFPKKFFLKPITEGPSHIKTKKVDPKGRPFLFLYIP